MTEPSVSLVDRLRDFGAGFDQRHGASLVFEAADAIEELDDELAHAYWDSCGCLAGGMGHRKGSAKCRTPDTAFSDPSIATEHAGDTVERESAILKQLSEGK